VFFFCILFINLKVIPWGGILIFITVTLAHTLPMWNSAAANFIRDELSAPKTNIGKFAYRASLLLVPSTGILGAMSASILHREDKSKALSFILVRLFRLLATALPYAHRFSSSPWEGKGK
jgi:hypothetical protein